jgi:hypothetical protein
MSDGKFAVLHQRIRCVHHGRQLGRFGVTAAPCTRKENSVHRQNQISGAKLNFLAVVL